MCALLTYTFWWNKPQDVHNSVDVKLVDDGPGIPSSFPLKEHVYPGLEVTFAAKEILGCNPAARPGSMPEDPDTIDGEDNMCYVGRNGYILTHFDGQPPMDQYQLTHRSAKEELDEIIARPDQGRLITSRNKMTLDARIAVVRSSMIPSDGHLQSNKFSRAETKVKGLLGQGQMLTFFGLLIAASALYGGLHLVAWSAPFPSYTQRLLWRISAVIVTASGLPIGVLFVAFGNVTKTAHMIHRRTVWMTIFWIMLHLTVIPALAFLLLGIYVVARAYLLVECFISLAYSPPGVFSVPNWAAYVPHIS